MVEKSAMIIELLTEYKDLFAWSYEDMKELEPKFYQHRIHLNKDEKLVQKRQYHMNPNYAIKVKKATSLSLLVVVPKNNGKIQGCIDYLKLNAAPIYQQSTGCRCKSQGL